MLNGEQAVVDLLKVADAYIAHTGVASSTLSKKALNDGADLFGRLRANPGAIVLRRVNEAMCVLSHNWPPDLDWPDGVPRPTLGDVERVIGRPTPIAVKPRTEEEEVAP